LLSFWSFYLRSVLVLRFLFGILLLSSLGDLYVKCSLAQEGQNGCAFTNSYDFLRQADEVHEAYEAYDVTKLRRYEITNFLGLSPFYQISFEILGSFSFILSIRSASRLTFFIDYKFLLSTKISFGVFHSGFMVWIFFHITMVSFYFA